MPVSGYEEPGVKSLARNSSDSVAGVPIKKRKFPLILPQSPPSETPSPQVEPYIQEKEHTSLKTESPANAGGTKEVYGTVGAYSSSSSEGKGEISADRNDYLVQRKGYLPGFSLQEPTLAVVSGSGTEMDSKGKLMLADRSASLRNSELQLALKGAIVPQIVEVSGKVKLERDDKSHYFKIPGNTELLLGPTEPLLSDLMSQNCQGSSEKQELKDPCSLNLALTKGQNNAHRKSNSSESNIDCTHLRANRSHWDLNTSMDTWEGSINDAAATHEVGGVDGLDKPIIHDIKHGISLTEAILRKPENTYVTSGKQNLDENKCRSKFPSLSNLLNQQSKSKDPLHLHLSPSGLQSGLSQRHSYLSTTVDSKRAQSFLGQSPASKLNLVGCEIVKSEPFDDSNKQDFNVAKVGSAKLVNHRIVKSEPDEAYNQESFKPLNMSTLKLMDHGFVKSEPAYGGNREALYVVAGKQNQLELSRCTAEVPNIGNVSHHLGFPTCGMEMPSTEQVPHSLKFSICSMRLPTRGEVSSQSDFSICTKGVPGNGDVDQVECENFGGFNLNVVSGSVGHDADPDTKKSFIGDILLSTSKTEGIDGADLNSSRPKSTDEIRTDSYRHFEVAQSDEEKIDISTDMLEDDSYGTDYESDANHDLGIMDTEQKQNGVEDDDYEDGEVREPVVHTAIESVVCEGREATHIDSGEPDSGDASVSGFPGGDHVTTSRGENRVAKIEKLGDIKNSNCSGECDNSLLIEKNDKDSSKVACLQESSVVEEPSTGSGKKVPIKAARRKPLNPLGRDDGLKSCETEIASDHAPSASQSTATGDAQCDAVIQQEHVKGTDSVAMEHLILPKTSITDDESVKDVNSRGSQSRIIKLAQAFNGLSSGRMRSIPGRTVPSRIERERFTDVVHRGDKLHLRGSRDEGYMNGPHKFERERNQHQAVGNSGSNFMRGRGRVGRGRVGNRLHGLRGDWNSDREAPEHYSGPTGYRYPRAKNAASVASTKLECNGFIVAPDGPGRGRRKLSNEELPIFRPYSRRRSPGGREGPVPHGAQLVCRAPRDIISPDRCIGRGSIDLVGLRHEENFMRGLPDDMMEPVFSQSQPQYERGDPFLREDRSFSPIQRRAPPRIPRIHSKSPPRSRSRSPGPWSSPRRRSPCGFDGHPAMTRRRSPPIYRIDRMRSPHQRPCFTEDMLGRRHGSPPFMSGLPNDMRDMSSAREHDHPRSFIPSRSPSGRVLPRSNRRFDMLDSRERTENDEYFDGPLHSDRFQELGGDGDVDERKFSERHGPAHSFRPSYNGSDVENFRFHVEDGPRPYRFCPEAESEFHERVGLREREFNRRLKTRPGNAPRRTRSIEEQEENYRHGGQGWNNTGFEDVAQVKRRRF